MRVLKIVHSVFTVSPAVVRPIQWADRVGVEPVQHLSCVFCSVLGTPPGPGHPLPVFLARKTQATRPPTFQRVFLTRRSSTRDHFIPSLPTSSTQKKCPTPLPQTRPDPANHTPRPLISISLSGKKDLSGLSPFSLCEMYLVAEVERKI